MNKVVKTIGKINEENIETMFSLPALYLAATSPSFLPFSIKKFFLAIGFRKGNNSSFILMSNIGLNPFSIRLHLTPRNWALLPMLLSFDGSGDASATNWRFYWGPLSIERPQLSKEEFSCDSVYENLLANHETIFTNLYFLKAF